MILMKKAGKVLRSVLKFIFSRLMLEIILVVLQVYVLFSWIYSTALAYQITTLLNVFSIILVIFVINEDEDPSFKLGWTVMILALPIFGGMMLVGLSAAMVSGTWWSWSGVAVFIASCAVQVRIEEAHLEASFGQSYREFRSSVPRWVGFGTAA